MLRFCQQWLLCKLGSHIWFHDYVNYCPGSHPYYYCNRLEPWGKNCGAEFTDKVYRRIIEHAQKKVHW